MEVWQNLSEWHQGFWIGFLFCFIANLIGAFITGIIRGTIKFIKGEIPENDSK